MLADRGCAERGCACYDSRIDGIGVEMVVRQWVGLTDEEIDAVCAPLGFAQLSPREVARAIEAKLKEKNT